MYVGTYDHPRAIIDLIQYFFVVNRLEPVTAEEHCTTSNSLAFNRCFFPFLIKHNQRWFLCLLLMFHFDICSSFSAFFCSTVPINIILCARYTFSLNHRDLNRRHCTFEVIFFPFNFILCPFLRFPSSSSSFRPPSWTYGYRFCLKASRRMTNCKYSSWLEREKNAVYKTQKSFNKHHFLVYISSCVLCFAVLFRGTSSEWDCCVYI